MSAAAGTLSFLPQTKCLDGSPAGLYVADGSASSNKVVIYLEGGGVCASEADCIKRSLGPLGSSDSWTHELTFTTILSGNADINPDFYDATRVFVPYCSGDVWIGQMEEATNPWATSGTELYFSGHNILQDVLDQLNTTITDATDVLLTGCSAGGIGTFHNADWFAASVREIAADAGVNVRAAPQAGWFGLPFNDYDDWVEGKNSSDPMHQNYVQWIYNVRPFTLDSASPSAVRCMADPSINDTLCGGVPYSYPYIDTELFIMENAADSYQIESQGGWTDGDDEGYIPYVNSVLATDVYRQVIKAGSGDGLYMPACLDHCGHLWIPEAPTIDGSTVTEAIGNWMFDRSGPTQLYNLDNDYDDLSRCVST